MVAAPHRPSIAVQGVGVGSGRPTHDDYHHHEAKHKPHARAGGAPHRHVTPRHVFHLVRRLCILAAAVVYLVTSIQATLKAYHVLRGLRNPSVAFESYDTRNILQYVGDGRIRDSPLVLGVLQNDTSKRAFSVFLESDGRVSFTNCSTPKFQARMYSNFFLRLAFSTLRRDSNYNVTELRVHDLIAPIVDCSFEPIARGYETIARVFYLTRHVEDPNDVLLISMRFSMQDFVIVEQNQRGPFGVGTHQYIRDMAAPKVLMTRYTGTLGYPFEIAVAEVYENAGLNGEGWWVWNRVPPTPTSVPTQALTAQRTGFFVDAETEQSNIKNLHWTITEDPKSALTTWDWHGEPVLRDSWAWVHFVHVAFALDGVVNLLVLVVVMYRNFQMGKIWVGDAFVSVSTTLPLRGALILLSWLFNGFWSITEFCLHDAHRLAGTQEIFIFPEIAKADLLTLYLAIASGLGHVVRERIDPALVILVFFVAFDARLTIVGWFPSVRDAIVAVAQADHSRAILSVSETVSIYSPLRLWTTHELEGIHATFIFRCLLPFFVSLLVLVAYVLARKAYWRLFPPKVRKRDSVNGSSKVVNAGDSVLSLKRDLTLFEIATGAELQSRFGVVSDYENCLYIKGMKYASADGIFCNGFVIARGKYLLATVDLAPLVLMKLTHLRLQNVYAYAIEGSTVQQTARLVYPETLTWTELSHLNVTVLS